MTYRSRSNYFKTADQHINTLVYIRVGELGVPVSQHPLADAASIICNCFQNRCHRIELRLH
jgi:hypothetical protein